MGSKNDTIIGYKYYIGMHQVLCYGPIDEIQQINVDDRMAWNDGQTGSGTLTIDAPKLFGGTDREGGISGDVDIAMGETTQTANTYLESILSPYDDDMPIPAFRGVVSAFLKQVYIGLNPYLKRWAWKAKRTQTAYNGGAMWYIAKADIDGDMNPAHIIRECYLSKDWGMGYPESAIDDAAWKTAADTLYSEDFGLSFQWLRQESIEDFTRMVLSYISGSVVVDPVSGLFVLKLIRDDYVPANLPLFDESNTLELVKFERRGWGETTNEVTVTYTDRETGKAKPVTLQNVANINMQGRVVAMSRDYAAVTSPSLAARLCQRDLGIMSAPLASLDIVVNRHAWDLQKGDAFRFTWPDANLNDVVFRVGNIDWGNVDDGKITLSAIEDYFTMPSGSYWEEQPPGWIDPDTPPAIDTITTEQEIIELPYYEWAMRISDADRAYLSDDVGFIGTLEREPHGNTFWYGYNLYTAANNDAPPTTPPIEDSTYDYDFDLTAADHMDVSIGAGQTLIFRGKFTAAAGQSFVHVSAVPLGGSPCFVWGVKFYNYLDSTCHYEQSCDIATDATYTSWVVARNTYFYVTLTNSGGACTVRVTQNGENTY